LEHGLLKKTLYIYSYQQGVEPRENGLQWTRKLEMLYAVDRSDAVEQIVRLKQTLEGPFLEQALEASPSGFGLIFDQARPGVF
jgi:hypothetical protein